MIEIRKAAIEDEARIINLLKLLALSSETPSDSTVDWQMAAIKFREIVKDDEEGTILVAEQDGDAVGVITLSYPVAIRYGGIYTCIEEFIVSEQARGKGIGGQLLEAAIAEATTRGCYEIQVNNPSKLGYPVYVRHGFQDLGKHLKTKLPHPAP